MPHPLPVLDRELYAKFNACVHCGLCLPACPTYLETGLEVDSPRGRIHLMKAAADHRIAPSDIVFEHLDRCLVCRACETACPSGVDYHTLIEHVRPLVAEAALGKGKRMRKNMLAWAIRHILPHRGRMRRALGALGMARKLGLGRLIQKFAPGTLPLAAASEPLKNQSPPSRAAGRSTGEFAPTGPQRGTVLLLSGCVGAVLSQNLTAACIRVLTRNGFLVRTLAHERCCGALAAHANDPASARASALSLLDSLADQNCDAILSPIAGCGAQLKEFHCILAHTPRAADAAIFAKKIRDITEFLAAAGIDPPNHHIDKRIAYHDPCHLCHAQRITAAPRQLLAQIPGVTLIPLAESDLCCGAAGTYSLNQPALATALAQRKIKNIAAAHPDELATANIGCTLHLTRHLRRAGNPMPVRHVVEILAEAYGG